MIRTATVVEDRHGVSVSVTDAMLGFLPCYHQGARQLDEAHNRREDVRGFVASLTVTEMKLLEKGFYGEPLLEEGRLFTRWSGYFFEAPPGQPESFRGENLYLLPATVTEFHCDDGPVSAQHWVVKNLEAVDEVRLPEFGGLWTVAVCRKATPEGAAWLLGYTELPGEGREPYLIKF